MIDQLLRMMPSFKGKQRLARFILANKITSGKDVDVLGMFGCHYRLPNVLENIGFEILINGIYEPATVKFICDRLKLNGVFLDVGANIGAIGIPVCKQRQDIIAIGLEAAPWIFEYLKFNIESNKITNMEVINKAISDRSDLKVKFYSPKDKFGKGSLAPVFTSEAVQVDTITLDELSHKASIDLIKIDVEGFEVLAFRGGSELLGSHQAPDILFEFVDWAEEMANVQTGNAQQQLIDYGYKLFHIKYGKIKEQLKSPITKGGHLIFATKEK